MEKYDPYLKCYNDVINKTSTKEAPWYVLPGDQRWYTRYLITEILLEVLKKCNPKYPALPDDEAEKLPECRKILTEALEKYDKKGAENKKEKAASKKKSKK